MGNPIDLPVQCLYRLLCNKGQKWICGFENFDIAKDFGNVCSGYLFFVTSCLGSNPYVWGPTLMTFFKTLGVLKLIINLVPLGKLLVNILFWFPFLVLPPHD